VILVFPTSIESRHVDQAGDLRVSACLGDDSTTVRVPDQNHRTVLLGDHFLGEGDVIHQGYGTVLHHGDVVSVFLESLVDTVAFRAPPT